MILILKNNVAVRKRTRAKMVHACVVQMANNVVSKGKANGVARLARLAEKNIMFAMEVTNARIIEQLAKKMQRHVVVQQRIALAARQNLKNAAV